MKPVKQTEDMKENTIPAPQNTETTEKKKRSRWVVIGVVVGVVAIITIAAIVIASFYWGNKMAEDNFKEAWVTFSDSKGNRSITEKVVVTKSEADFTHPGQLRMILDFEGRMKVIRSDDERIDEEEECICLVSDWNIDPGTSTEADRQFLTNTHVNCTAHYSEIKHTFNQTSEIVDISSLSPRAREMCFDCKIIKTVETVETLDAGTTDAKTRRKRKTCTQTCSVVCTANPPACSNVCTNVCKSWWWG